jgi:diguanylate cyclase (GGDEF)-like protein
MIGLIPNEELQIQQARTALSETTAISFMALAPRMEIDELKHTLEMIRERNPDVRSIAVREASGKVVLESDRHTGVWQSTTDTFAKDENVVPISSQGEPWGQLEVRWAPHGGVRVFGKTVRTDLTLTIFVAASLFVGFSVFLRRVLRQINPSKVVPNRVRDALNALSEGLLVLDCDNSIVLANESFATATGKSTDTLLGTRPGQFAFQVVDGNGEATTDILPWDASTRREKPTKGILLAHGEGEDRRTYSVSTVPVKNEKNVTRGLVASFEDVTLLQRKQEELRFALTSLRVSTDEVRKQNHELEWLATRDTLTGCLNRRSFFHDFENYWRDAQTQQLPMSGVMVDIDFFKAVNDNHGHGMGDEVLRQMSAVLMKTVGETDLVCRYGGEEFTILMPNTTIDDAEMKAEQCRLAVKSLRFEKLSITASLGVSALCQNPESPQDLLDQAGRCLYVAKRNGRNQVVRWDRAQAQIAKMETETAPTREQEMTHKAASAIPYHAVAALTSALAHRDQSTAVHSRRVADMCVATGEGLLSLRECYVLEITALLHDKHPLTNNRT